MAFGRDDVRYAGHAAVLGGESPLRPWELGRYMKARAVPQGLV